MTDRPKIVNIRLVGKLFRIKDYILLSAAFTGDLLEVTRSGWGVMPSAMKNMYGFIPSNWKYSSYLTRVSGMLTTGDIKKTVGKRGGVYLELTSSGKTNFRRRFPLFMRARKWDGYFMIITFDIPEKERSIRRSLREKLEQLGFGRLQMSVYISPYHFEEDMDEFLNENSLKEDVFVLTAKKLLTDDLKVFAQKVWKVKKINKGYLGIIKYIEKRQKRGVKDKDKFAKKAIKRYLKILVKDPMLPYEFLPDNWARKEALKLINSI